MQLMLRKNQVIQSLSRNNVLSYKNLSISKQWNYKSFGDAECVQIKLALFSLRSEIIYSTNRKMHQYPINLFFVFCNCYLAAPRPTLGHYLRGSLTHPILVTTFFRIFDPEVTGSLLTRLGP